MVKYKIHLLLVKTFLTFKYSDIENNIAEFNVILPLYNVHLSGSGILKKFSYIISTQKL